MERSTSPLHILSYSSEEDAIPIDEPPPTGVGAPSLSSSVLELPTNIAADWKSSKQNELDQPLTQKFYNTRASDRLLKAVCISLSEATALPYGKQRSIKILYLFESLIYPIEPECLVKLYGTFEGKVTKRYYQAVAKRFAEIEDCDGTQEFKNIQENLATFFPTLRANPNFPQLFSLLFYRWLFYSTMPHPSLTKQMGLFLKGVNRLFWMDLETGRAYFRPVFNFLKNKVLFNALFWDLEQDIFKHLSSIFRVISKFFFYYETLDDLSLFLTKIQDNVLPVRHQIKRSSDVDLSSDHSITNMLSSIDASQKELSASLAAHELIGTPLIDIFLPVATRTCNNIRNETVLVNYIESFRVFKYASFKGRNDALLFTTLQTFSNPGGPMYPPKSVRIVANRVLGECFPQGKWIRTAIKYGFRLLHPIRLMQALFVRILAVLLLLKTIIILLLNPFNIVRAASYFRSGKQKPDLPVKNDKKKD